MWCAPQSEPWSSRIASFSDQRNVPTFWYLIQDGKPNGSAYLEGYNAANGQRVGYLGKDGFRASLPSATELFPLICGGIYEQVSVFNNSQTARIPSDQNSTNSGYDPAAVLLVGADHRVYECNFVDRSVRTLLDGLEVESFSNRLRSWPGDSGIVVRTDGEILVLDAHHQIERRYAIPRELASQEFEWAEISPGAGAAIVYERTADWTCDVHLRWFDAAGRITRSEHATIPGVSERSEELGMALPMPVIVGLIGLEYPNRLVASGFAKDWFDALSRLARLFWAPVLQTTLLSALLAIACLRRQTRYALSRRERVVWPLFVFAFGPPGWIGYRLGRRWPVLERCPFCRVATPRDSAQCAHCHADMPRPPALGIELVTI
jgi:hypothetical protein